MRSAVATLPNQLAERAQPYPVAIGVTHPKGMIHLACLRVGEMSREFIEIDVVGMDERVHFAEAHQRISRPQPSNRVHGMRPEYAPAREIPVPQTAAPAI